jgi:hypothetical protein
MNVRWMAVIFGLALALRLVYVASTTITPISDAERYLGHADRLIARQGFVSADGVPTAYTPPGYPFFIAAVQSALGPGYRPVAYVQALLGAVSCLLTFLLCSRLFDLRHAIAAGLLLAVSPATIPYSGGLLSEVPTSVLILGVLVLLAPAREDTDIGLARTAGAGVLLGTAILFRPAIMAVAFGLGLYTLLGTGVSFRRRFSSAAVLTAVTVVVLLPWGYRNYRVYERVVPVSTMGGYDLYMGNNPEAYGGGYMALEGEQELRKWRQPADEVNGEQEARRRAIEWMRENPSGYVAVSIRRALKWVSVTPDYVPGTRLTSTEEVDRAILDAFRTRAATGVDRETAIVQQSRRLNAALLLLWSIVTVPLALAGIVFDLSSRPKWLLLSPLTAYAIALSLAFMDLRYREIVMPLLLIYTAAGAIGLRSVAGQWSQATPLSKGILLAGVPVLLAFGIQLLRDRAVFTMIAGGL